MYRERCAFEERRERVREEREKGMYVYMIILLKEK
jgi:hypothetical protein